jgi:hypothetical protein
MPVPYRPGALTKRPIGQLVPWGINHRFRWLSPCTGWVAYALRTRAPLSSAPKGRIPFDLHVLGLPLAFILSQDQTLRCIVSGAAGLARRPFSFLCFPGPPAATPTGTPAFMYVCLPQSLKELAGRLTRPNAAGPVVRHSPERERKGRQNAPNNKKKTSFFPGESPASRRPTPFGITKVQTFSFPARGISQVFFFHLNIRSINF